MIKVSGFDCYGSDVVKRAEKIRFIVIMTLPNPKAEITGCMEMAGKKFRATTTNFLVSFCPRLLLGNPSDHIECSSSESSFLPHASFQPVLAAISRHTLEKLIPASLTQLHHVHPLHSS
jgi:hypothetical protein